MAINIIDFIFNMENVTFDMCGLDAERNMLSAPLCDCGCGRKMNICLETSEDIDDFCSFTVSDSDCEFCACFAISCDNEIYCAIRCEEDIYHVHTDTLDDIKDIKDSIGGMVNELGLHCYGLIVEKEPGVWKIVED